VRYTMHLDQLLPDGSTTQTRRNNQIRGTVSSRCALLTGSALTLLSLFETSSYAQEMPNALRTIIADTCYECHDDALARNDLALDSLSFDLDDRALRDRWTYIHDRVAKGEMPPDPTDLSDENRQSFVQLLGAALATADRADVMANGRGPMRRLNREEYEENLRDLLLLPHLDIKTMLPQDREGHRLNKTAETLDMSRVQLAAYLDAADAALRQAMASGSEPPPVTTYRAIGVQLFAENQTFGNREAMFFAKDNQAVDTKALGPLKADPSLEMALFRSAHWPYYGYPRGFVAALPGAYRVRFSARAVLQQPGYTLEPATQPVPMTFRARKPSGADVSGDVRATGGLMDIQPEAQVYETVIHLLPTETFEYSLLGLPVPLARNVDGGPPTYRYPPFPEGGQPGVAFQWLEVEGPLPPETWPPPSHHVLFDELGAEVATEDPVADARRLMRRFAERSAREPVSEEVLLRFENLILGRLVESNSFVESMLAGYKAFLASSHFLYLREPVEPTADRANHYAIASRLSHFLTNTRPDAPLLELAREEQLREADILHRETDRLIDTPDFDHFVENFTDYWLNLRYIRRDDADIRLYPEYRFDEYLVESMARESRSFFAAMIRDNLPASVVIDADFVYANDRLAKHYGLEPLAGSAMRKVPVPEDSPYGGLLTQAAVLKVTANGTSTSPVIRGAWIMERLLGQEPPPPPPSVPAVEPDIRGATTIRDLLALHTKSKKCASCHAHFDPVGLALENFGVLGNWRERYRGVESGDPVTGIDPAGHDFAYTLGAPVDASGSLVDGRSFEDIQGLKAIFADNSRQLARNLLHQFTLYATGTPVRFADRDAIESILDDCAETGYRVRDLIHGLVASDIFLGKELDT